MRQLPTSFAILSLALTCSAQTRNWTQETPTTKPPARSAHALAYDAARQRVVLFGGYGVTPAGPLQDTWEWNGTTWTEIKPTTKPPARLGHALAYDAGRKRVVMFGGWDITARLQDTWEWNGTAWTEIKRTTKPPARDFHGLAYDAARKRVVLFGGRSASTSELQDTWEWNGAMWTEIKLRTKPPARAYHALAYDEARQRVVLFGGRKGTGRLEDTWERNGTSWTEIKPTKKPAARDGYGLAYDAAHKRVLLFGGWDGTSAVQDTWQWDGTAWTQSKPTTNPPARDYLALAYDAARQQVVLFGGATAFQDTWTFGAGGFAAYGIGCGDPVATLSPRSDPKIGKSIVLESWNLSATALVGVQALGVFKLSVDLTGAGMPSCWLLQSLEMMFPFAVSNGKGQFTLPVPNDQGLVGLKLPFQSLIRDLNANAAGWLTTNGGEVEVLK